MMIREGENGGKRVVFFQPPGSKIPNGCKNKPSNEHWLLEDDRERQGDLQQCHIGVGWDEEDLSFLQRESSQRRENQLGHA